MKLFIWDHGNLLGRDFQGMVVAMAKDIQDARLAIKDVDEAAIQSLATHKPTRIVELGIVDHPRFAHVVWGGG